MQIYASEKDIADKINDNVVKASCQILPRTHKIDATKLSFANNYDKDLYRMYAIMVSSGMNKNDDVFVKGELWGSKDTPIDKPLNIEHSPRSIIGHIIESRMIDDSYEMMDEMDEEDDDEMYHILTGGVIYRHLNSVDKDLEKECAKLIDEIDNGEWYVSMECLFNDFDYALIHPVFGKRYIKRDESTSFLTKYLRAYGGEGNYNGSRIGRVLRGLLFSGKGLVKNPANPNSIILNNVESFNGVYASLEELNLDEEKKGDLDMADNFESKYNEAQNEIKQLRDRLAEAGEEKSKQLIQAKDEEIAQLNSQVAQMKTQLDELTEKFNTISKSKEEIEVAKASLDAEIKTKNEELARIQAEKVKVDRVAILVSAGVDKAEAEKLIERFISVTDEQFAEIVELQKKIIVSASNVIPPVIDDVVVDDKALDDVVVTDDVSLATDTTAQDDDDKVQSAFASWVDQIFNK